MRPISTMSNFLIPLLALALLSGGAVLLAQSNHGPGVSMDSLFYIAIADNLDAGRGFTSPFQLWDEVGPPSHISLWPPVFPLLLALFKSICLSPITTGAFFNALLLACSVVLFAYHAFRMTGSPGMGLCVGAGVALAPPLVMCASYIWTEVSFILVVMVALWLLIEGLESKRRRTLVASALLTALGCMLRYIGVVTIFTGVVAIFCHPCLALKDGKRWRKAIWYSLIAGIPLFLWLMYSFIASGSPVGQRGRSPYGLLTNLSRIGEVVGVWLTNPGLARWLHLWVGFAFLALVAVGVIIILRRMRGELDGRGRLVVIVLVVYILLYLSGLVFLATTVKFDFLDSRLLAPIFPPLLLLVVFILRKFFFAQRSGIGAKRFALLLFLVWLSAATFSTGGYLIRMYGDGSSGYANPMWQEGIAELSRILPKDAPLVSNYPYPIYLYSLRKAKISPQVTDRAVDFGEYMADSGAVLVWFPEKWREEYQIGEEELVEGGELKLIGETKLAKLYVSAK